MCFSCLDGRPLETFGTSARSQAKSQKVVPSSAALNPHVVLQQKGSLQFPFKKDVGKM